MLIAAIVAISQNGVIGVENCLPWHLPADLRHFKQLTTSHTVVMGRKTYESIGKPLPNRQNIVISRQKNYIADGCIVVESLENAIEIARKSDAEKVFIIGGAEIYRLALQNTSQNTSLCTHIYLTYVHTTVHGDAFLEFDNTVWHETERKHVEADEKNIFAMDFVTLENVSGVAAG